MPARRRIEIIGQHSKDRSVFVDNQETLNFITSVKGQGAKAPIVLESAPGLVDIGTAGDGAIRSPQIIQWIHPTDKTKDAYGVWGQELVRISTASGAVNIGSLDAAVTASRCRIARGRTHIMVVDGSFGYTYDGTTFAKITDLDFPDQSGSGTAGRPTHVVYLDGFFIIVDADTDNFYISDLEDPTSWNALEFEAAAVAPDNALALAATNSLLWILGDETAQPYYNSGNADFPYALALSGVQEVGILAPQSIADSDMGVFYLATTPEGGRFVYQIQGTQGRIISGDAQEHQLSEVSNIADVYGYIYQQAGKAFYVLQLGTSVPSLVYNIRAGAWETRALVDGSGYRIGGAGVFDGNVIGGSRLSARYLRLDLTNYSDAGQSFIRRRVTQVQSVNNQLMDWWEFVVDLETGVGLVSGDGSDPQLRMRYSDDGGMTWSAQLIEPIGAAGERGKKVAYRNLGQSRHRVFELEVADPVPVTIIAAYAFVEFLDD